MMRVLLPAIVAIAIATSPTLVHAQTGQDGEDGDDLGPGASAAEQQRRADDSAGDQGMEDDIEGDPPSIGRREVPDFDGRPDPGISFEDAILWIPRVIFFPVQLVFEWIIRRPLGWILTTGERERWGAFQFPPFAEEEPEWGLVPTLFVDFGFQPSGGLYLWTDNVVVPRNGLRFQLGFGGVDWLRASVLDRYSFDDHGTMVQAKIAGTMRPDYLLAALNGQGESDELVRYGARSVEGEIAFAFRPWRSSHLRIEAGVRGYEFYDTDWIDDDDDQLTLSDGVAQGWLPYPPGWEGYVAYRQRLEGSIDSRQPRPIEGSGVRVEAFVEQGFDLLQAEDRRWLTYGGAVGAYWEISQGRTLGLWGGAEFATALGELPVPFTELPDLSGRGRMVGFRRGWLYGESIVWATLEYRYPIWITVDGFVNVTTGNAFGAELDGFDPAKLRMSFALGLRTVGDPDQSFTIQIGFGTDTFERGAEPAVLRITAGMQEGF
ncbi:hypothetical protein [Sandaracinus amylolyticus]|uniref:hypothetical protein n=1 Tax=Sandaracinus amylolyticus TaxID=927083 RepID=UPI001F39DEE4|nr:hypothetical protein [Sandaracinus amylolyticus]UJR86953.1 Hypothetical protein I5071_90540 [Sandaracinus amylolyticus]